MINEIQSELEKNSSKKQKISGENYLKGSVMRGLKMNQILEVYGVFKSRIKKLSTDEKISLALMLFKSKYFSDKRFAIQIFADNIKEFDNSILSDFFELFDTYINDWATCDVLSSKVISKLILKDNSIIDIMIAWSKSNKTWAKRASIISFVNLANKGDYDGTIINISQNLIKNDFRFIQLGVGWCLRNLSQKNLTLVLGFIKKNYSHFSREGLRYAVEKMNPELKTKVLKNDFLESVVF
ncbi:MAG: DNA alkylation repair protein [Candidatus Nanoarchaeia archaeon]|jgi:3-methyladenine DNA glycosylase AlkD